MQHARPPCPSQTPGVHPNPRRSSWWCHPAISSAVIPFSSCLQSFPASESFQTSQLFASGGQSIGDSASTSVLSMNTQDWSPLGWTGWISLQSKRRSRVFSNTTVQKHQFFGAHPSLWSNSHIHTWLLETPCCLVTKLCLTLCDPMDCSLPGFSVHGISQARILEWVAISCFRESSWPRDRTRVSFFAGGFFTMNHLGS